MIKRRNMMVQVMLFIVTFGLYSIYWFYVTSKEMVAYKNLNGRPVLWTILLFIPFGSLFSYWKHGKAVVGISDGKYPFILIYVLSLFFSPAVWLLTQLELNKLAEEQGFRYPAKTNPPPHRYAGE